RASELADRAAGLVAEASELARDLRAWREELRADPARLEDVNERLRVLRALQRKYGDGEEAILAFADNAARRLGGLSTADEERDTLEAECSELAERAATLAAGVSDARRKAAPALAEALEGELEELGMEGVSLRVELAPEPDLGPAGSERAELVFSGGPR